MSISAAIANSVSGLTAVSRGTEVVSSNIANALTPGYARRELELSSRVYERAGGVSVDGVTRMVNAALLADSRLANASVGSAHAISAFHAAMETAFGNGSTSESLGQALTAFESSLESAASRPDSETRLANVVSGAEDLANKLNLISESIQNERTMADRAIASDVSRLNSSLEQIAVLNKKITSLSAQGKDISSLLDQRQNVIDDISQIVPITEIPRENNRVALFTEGGAILIDGTDPAKFSFDSAVKITSDMSVTNGALSRLTFNGKEITEGQMSMFDGGQLSANFAIRDEVSMTYQNKADGFARELYDRLSDSATDPTLTTGPGLFTDQQGVFDAANELGFAGRISLNSIVIPAEGGDLWRVRAGINATAAGSSGDNTLLANLSSAITSSRIPSSSALPQGLQNLHGIAIELSSSAATARVTAEADELRTSTHQTSLMAALLSDGVDTDKEMESLLALERAYAANAKVFQAANDMLDSILRLT